jgi:hypothetical protein
MASSGERAVAFDGIKLGPFGGFTIEDIEIVEGNTLIVDTAMTSEDIDFVLMVGGRTIGTRLWSTYLAFSIFGLIT